MSHCKGKTVDPYLPYTAVIRAYRNESPSIFTLDLCFNDPVVQQSFSFYPGQFNMLYLYGVGEVAISISSDPDNTEVVSHTIRAVGRVTKAMHALREGDEVGVRGPYGNGWPLAAARGPRGRGRRVPAAPSRRGPHRGACDRQRRRPLPVPREPPARRGAHRLWCDKNIPRGKAQ